MRAAIFQSIGVSFLKTKVVERIAFCDVSRAPALRFKRPLKAALDDTLGSVPPQRRAPAVWSKKIFGRSRFQDLGLPPFCRFLVARWGAFVSAF